MPTSCSQPNVAAEALCGGSPCLPPRDMKAGRGVRAVRHTELPRSCCTLTSQLLRQVSETQYTEVTVCVVCYSLASNFKQFGTGPEALAADTVT